MNNNAVQEIENKNILVVGMGKSGIAVVYALCEMGAIVSIQDSKPRENVNKDLLEFISKNNIKSYFECMPSLDEHFDMIVLSPGVNPEIEYFQKKASEGTEIIGELELAYRISEGTFVAITGTNGKTTTTTLVGEIFKNSKRNTYVVGNIGVAVISKALESQKEDWLITETSSFQLQTIKSFRPRVSAMLNLTPDHLNRHHTMELYGKAKARIFENQDETEYFIVNYDDKLCYSFSKNCKAKIVPFSRKEELDFGGFVKGDKLVIKDLDGKLVEIINKNDLKIIGEHNVENALSAALICYFSGIDIDVISKTLSEFKGVEHRIEYVDEIDGVKFYNDSKGTNVDAAVIAIRAIKKNIILIAGGDGKSQEFDDLFKNFNGSVKHVVLLGRDKDIIAKTADKYGFKDYSFAKDMKECVKKAFELSESGDTVLLSPACASWDMYNNFEERGDDFKRCVKELHI